MFGDKFRICIQICENPNVLGLQVFGLRVRFKANPLNLTTHYVMGLELSHSNTHLNTNILKSQFKGVYVFG